MELQEQSDPGWRPLLPLPLPLTSEDNKFIGFPLFLSPHNSQAKVWMPTPTPTPPPWSSQALRSPPGDLTA